MRLVASFAFVFLCWCAIAAGSAGRACSSSFSPGAALTGVFLSLVFGFLLWLPVVGIIGSIVSAVSERMPASTITLQRHTMWVAPLLLFGCFVLITKPHGSCPMP